MVSEFIVSINMTLKIYITDVIELSKQVRLKV